MERLHCTACEERFFTASPAWMVRHARPCPECGGDLQFETEPEAPPQASAGLAVAMAAGQAHAA